MATKILKKVPLDRLEKVPGLLLKNQSNPLTGSAKRNEDKVWSLQQNSLIFDLSKNGDLDQRQVIVPIINHKGNQVASIARYGAFITVQPAFLEGKNSSLAIKIVAELFKVLPLLGYSNVRAMTYNASQKLQLAKLVEKQNFDTAYQVNKASPITLEFSTQGLSKSDLNVAEAQSKAYQERLENSGFRNLKLKPTPGATWGKKPQPALDPGASPTHSKTPKPAPAA